MSHLGVLGPDRATEALSERAELLAGLIGEDQRHLDEALGSRDVLRLFVIEAEYGLAMLRAGRDWALALIEDISSGRLAWPQPRGQDQEGQR